MLVWTSTDSSGHPKQYAEVVDINYGGNWVACEGGENKRYLKKKGMSKNWRCTAATFSRLQVWFVMPYALFRLEDYTNVSKGLSLFKSHFTRLNLAYFLWKLVFGHLSIIVKVGCSRPGLAVAAEWRQLCWRHLHRPSSPCTGTFRPNYTDCVQVFPVEIIHLGSVGHLQRSLGPWPLIRPETSTDRPGNPDGIWRGRRQGWHQHVGIA